MKWRLREGNGEALYNIGVEVFFLGFNIFVFIITNNTNNN